MQRTHKDAELTKITPRPSKKRKSDTPKTRTKIAMDDRLALVEMVHLHGKNWKKVLDSLQNEKHIWLHIALDDYSKLLDAYRSILKTLQVEFKWPKVISHHQRILFTPLAGEV